STSVVHCLRKAQPTTHDDDPPLHDALPICRAEIRRNLMQHATALNKQTTGGPGPLSQPALTNPATYNPWVRRRPAASRTPSGWRDRKSTRLNSSHAKISYAVVCSNKKLRPT